MASFHTRELEYIAPQCRICSLQHRYLLEVRWIGKIIFFGGKDKTASDETLKSNEWEVQFTCLTTGELFTDKVSVDPEKNEKIVSVISRDSQTSLQAPPLSLGSESTPSLDRDAMVQAELNAWMSSSSANAREFCKTMLTILTGAIPVFFAILKYLGIDRPTPTVPGWMGILPSGAFLAAIVLLILALRPQYLAVDTLAEFSEIRSHRFEQMNRFIVAGTIFFVVGVLLAILIFIWALAV